jgi:hypothetical protein
MKLTFQASKQTNKQQNFAQLRNGLASTASSLSAEVLKNRLHFSANSQLSRRDLGIIEVEDTVITSLRIMK